MASFTIQGKRARTASTSGQAGCSNELRDEQYNVVFSDEIQKSRFDKLKVREVIPTRFFDHGTLERLGLDVMLSTLMNNLGWGTLFNMYHNTYPGLTYEFLSSLKDGKFRNQKALYFRVNNRDCRCTLSELGGYFGLSLAGNPKGDSSTLSYEIWRAITGIGLDNLDTSHLYLKLIHHPCLRIFAKFLAAGLFARSDQNSMRTQENALLGTVLRPNSDIKPVVPLLLYRYLLSLSNRISRERIAIGGIITRIATFHGFVDSPDRVPDALLDFDHLHLCNYFRVSTPSTVEWLYPQGTIELPTHNLLLPPLEADRDNYLLGVAEPVPRVQPPPQYSPFEQLVLDNFRNLNVRMDSMAESISGLQQQQQAAFSSMYGYFRHQGYDDGTFPSWYDPSGHGGAGSSGAGYDDPEDDDDEH